MRDTEKQYKQNNLSHKVFNLKTGTAVSYTHLDVYKRQVREDRDGRTSGAPVVMPMARLGSYVRNG